MMQRIELPASVIDARDLRALQDAIVLARASGWVGKEQDGIAAAHHCQVKSLQLRPWETPPMFVADPTNPRPGEQDAARLLREMLAYGLSRYCADPKRALAEAEAAEPSQMKPFPCRRPD